MFPNLKSQFMLDSNITHLNHGSYGACPKPIFDSHIKWQKKLESNPTKHLGFDILAICGSKRLKNKQYFSKNLKN